MITRDGGHLFYVSRVMQARSFSFEEVRLAIVKELVEERGRERLAAAAAELPLPEDRFIPSPEEVANIMRLGDRAAIQRGNDVTRAELPGDLTLAAEARHHLG